MFHTIHKRGLDIILYEGEMVLFGTVGAIPIEQARRIECDTPHGPHYVDLLAIEKNPVIKRGYWSRWTTCLEIVSGIWLGPEHTILDAFWRCIGDYCDRTGIAWTTAMA